jgi:hypothetical protein
MVLFVRHGFGDSCVMNNRMFGPYLAAIHRILISVMVGDPEIDEVRSLLGVCPWIEPTESSWATSCSG